jgi:cytochrome b561
MLHIEGEPTPAVGMPIREANMRNVSISADSVYDPGQRALHWLMAAVILAAIAIGLYAADLPKGDPSKGYWFGIHKSLGVSVLLLLIPRIVWRILKGVPAYRVPLDRLTLLAASAGHAALYVLMLALPVTGYVLSTAADRPVSWFGIFTLPRLLPVDKDLSHLAAETHETAAWILIAVLGVHVLAAFWHHWVKRDEVMARMVPHLARPEKQKI